MTPTPENDVKTDRAPSLLSPLLRRAALAATLVALAALPAEASPGKHARRWRERERCAPPVVVHAPRPVILPAHARLEGRWEVVWIEPVLEVRIDWFGRRRECVRTPGHWAKVWRPVPPCR